MLRKKVLYHILQVRNRTALFWDVSLNCANFVTSGKSTALSIKMASDVRPTAGIDVNAHRRSHGAADSVLLALCRIEMGCPIDVEPGSKELACRFVAGPIF